MCSCRQTTSSYAVVKVGRHYHIHSDGFCDSVKSSTWRMWLFLPVARFFLRLAGPSPLAQRVDHVFWDARKKVLDEQMERGRATLRAAMNAKADELGIK